jgi:septal ring factor EnvC (AmiA/AmiB activator)
MADTLNDSIDYIQAQIETTEQDLSETKAKLSRLRQDVLAMEARQRTEEALISGFNEALEMLEKAKNA